MTGRLTQGERSTRAKKLLWISVIATVLLYQLPFARWLVAPLLWFSTLAHELGHGIAGVFVGSKFESFELFFDGSGVARLSGPRSAIDQAVISAGGLCGPAIVAALGFAVARRRAMARMFLFAMVLALLAAELLVVRNLFGLLYVGAVAVGLLWFVRTKNSAWAQHLVVFLSVQLALSVFSRGDYLFMETASTGAGEIPSDVANMSTALGGPYWFWGAVCGVLSVGILLFGIRLYLKGVPLPTVRLSRPNWSKWFGRKEKEPPAEG